MGEEGFETKYVIKLEWLQRDENGINVNISYVKLVI